MNQSNEQSSALQARTDCEQPKKKGKQEADEMNSIQAQSKSEPMEDSANCPDSPQGNAEDNECFLPFAKTGQELPSVHLPFESIENCRDLAGMIAGDRLIRPGKLIRSGRLSKATPIDRDVLSLLGVSEIVDLRSEFERSLEPDRKIAGARNIHDPVLAEADMRQLAGGNIRLVEDAAKSSRELMNEAYAQMMLSEDGICAWRKLFAILMQADGGVLFHCTQGKDRTGAAAALIEHALGVDEKTILEDYLQTNLYMSKDAARDRMAASALFSKHENMALEDISSYLYAHRSYYDAMNNAVLTHYGSWDNYLRNGIGLDQSDFDLLQEKFLC